MNDADVSKQIQQMVRFIRQEAEEKANEISVSAEEEFNIEKLQLVEAEKKKIRQEYERKEKQVEIRRKIEYSMQLNASRLKVLQAQDDLVSSMKEAAAKELLHSLLRLKEPAVLLRCRKEDLELVDSILDSAKDEYANKSNVHPPGILVDNHIYLPPPPSRHHEHGLFCSGGVVLASRDGKIVCENTLDARLDVVFRNKLPEHLDCRAEFRFNDRVIRQTATLSCECLLMANAGCYRNITWNISVTAIGKPKEEDVNQSYQSKVEINGLTETADARYCFSCLGRRKDDCCCRGKLSSMGHFLRSVGAIWAIIFGWWVYVGGAAAAAGGGGKCKFEAIFNFGDSNSDTGGFYAAFPAASGPYGMTFFKRPSGRASDGRLVIDFFAQALGFPFLSPYLQSIGSNYRHGANFATLASTVLLPNTSLFVTGISPFSLAIQLNQMKEFKARATEFHPKEDEKLPAKDVYGKSVYTFYIGQNDFTSKLAEMGIGGVQEYLPEVASQIGYTIEALYAEGGRAFLVFNMAPIGCYPAFLTQLPHTNTDLDMYGCMFTYNNAVSNYNNMLKGMLDQTRARLSNAWLVYVDIYSLMLELFRNPTRHGLLYGTKACCGYGGGAYNFNPQVYCGNNRVINGRRVTATACSDPDKYVSWDGIHATDAANKLVTWAILNGSYFDPPFPLSKLCDLQPIG
ncbi:hypothetical protein ACLOJK_010140 [Asimina triloba]